MHVSKKPPEGRLRVKMKKLLKRLSHAVSTDKLLGKEIEGYEIKKKIGHGGVASVYLAERGAGERIAVKVLEGLDSKDEKTAERFSLEAKAIIGINHPNVVKGYTHGEIDANTRYITMEYIEGRDLEEEAKTLDVRAKMGLILGACRGLGAVHAAGLIHRDIKPYNIMVGKGNAKIIDFGIAREVSAPRGEWKGVIYGTLNFVAPEQTSGNDYDRRVDIYSLGITAYKILCGQLPFESDQLRELLELIKIMQPYPPSLKAPHLGIPLAADEIVMKAISKAPGHRFQDALEMETALEKLLKS